MPLISTVGSSSVQALGAFDRKDPLYPNIGDAYGGGFYYGKIKVGADVYNLVISPKDRGEIYTTTSKWTTGAEITPSPTSVNDGFTNTYGDTSDPHVVVDWVKGLNINGFTDWYIPARDEMELMYRNLKPTTTPNSTIVQGSYPGEEPRLCGINYNSVPPGYAYTHTNPVQTTLPLFIEGGGQAMNTVTNYGVTCSSTAYGALGLLATNEHSGEVPQAPTTNALAYRAIRRVKAAPLIGAVDVPAEAGTPYGGGFYVGQFRLNGLLYALIVSPAATGMVTKAWSTTSPLTDDNTSDIDGYANSNINVSAVRPACQAVKALNIGGFTDWYIPARNEAELMYRNLKPTTTGNSSGTGANPDSVPVGAPYTSANPAQTTATDFRSPNGVEAITPAFYSSTKHPTNPIYLVSQTSTTGAVNPQPAVAAVNYRAVRRVLMAE